MGLDSHSHELLAVIMVSRLGLEPRTLALKGQIERLLHRLTKSD